MNVHPFRVKKKWYYVLKRKMYGPFESKQRCMEVYAIALELEKVVGKKRRDT